MGLRSVERTLRFPTVETCFCWLWDLRCAWSAHALDGREVLLFREIPVQPHWNFLALHDSRKTDLNHHWLISPGSCCEMLLSTGCRRVQKHGLLAGYWQGTDQYVFKLNWAGTRFLEFSGLLWLLCFSWEEPIQFVEIRGSKKKFTEQSRVAGRQVCFTTTFLEHLLYLLSSLRIYVPFKDE